MSPLDMTLEKHKDVTYQEISKVCKIVCDSDSRFRIAKNEEDETKDENKEAHEFLKFDEKRLGRDFKLYGFMAKIESAVGPALADFASVLMTIKQNSPESFKLIRSELESWKKYFDEDLQPAWVELWAAKERTMTRAEHLTWCKTRALEYIAQGNVENAYASMTTNLGKHPETAEHPAIQLGMMQMMGGMLKSPHDMKRFIEDFN